MATEDTPPAVFEIKKYPNRRFYDVTRSRHVTLTDLFELVRDGHRIIVHDSKTGADITHIVLTQIILEHDPPKLELFPASLLHQAIQSNQQMIRGFIDQYFAQAMDAFTRSRQQFDDFLSRSGFSALSPTAPFDWVRMLIPGVGRSSAGAKPTEASSPDGSGVHDANEASRQLRQELESLRAELADLKRGSAKRPRPRAAPRSKGSKKRK